MNYQVPQNINKDKIFIVNRSEINGRLDAHYNKPSYSELWRLLSSQNYELTNLRKNSICLFSGITPKSGGDAYVIDDGIPFVRSGDYSETNVIDFSQLLQLREDIHRGLMRNSQLRKNDLLIAIVGATIGKVGVYQYDIEANINQAICAVRLKEKLNPYYVQAFFQTDVGQKIIERIKRPVARANINIEEVGNLPIPMLSIHKQLEIVQIMEDGRKCKEKKDCEAQQLLDSIDEYLLTELEIAIPKVDETLNNRIFFTSFLKVEGIRIDPIFSLYLGKNVLSSKYENIHLSSIADIFKGNALTSAEIEEGNIPVIAGGQTSPYSHSQSNFDGNVITVSASGAYAGYVWYHDYPIYATDCNVIVSKDETRFMTKYLFEVLKLQQKAIYRLQTGAAQPHVYAADLQMLNIPVVSLEKQRKIVDCISNIRNIAKELEEEGKTILENAKHEVEQMIMKMK